MLGGQYAGVEEDEDDDEPVERLRLDGVTTALAHAAIQLRQTSPSSGPPTSLSRY